MCYANSITSPLQTFKEHYKRSFRDETRFQHYFCTSGFAFPLWPVITAFDEVAFMQWGLLPGWLKHQNSTSFAINTLNAKAETLTDKPSFKHLIASKRCLVPSNGFFEYQTNGKQKTPYFISLPEKALFSFAGLFDTWTHPENGTLKTTFTIITCPANELLSTIHNDKKRMPVILSRADEEEWLNTGSLQLLQPFNGALTAHPVDKRLMHTNTPLVQEAFYEPAQMHLF